MVGPSGKRWPRCEPQFLQRTSVLGIISEKSDFRITFPFLTSENDGQPVPESNFVSEGNRGAPQAAQWYIPFSLLLRYFPVKARSVPFSLRM